MALKADAQGFLIGGQPEPIDVQAFERSRAIMEAIKQDTAAIRKALVGGARAPRVSAMPVAAPAFTDRQASTVATKIAGKTAAASEAIARRVAQPRGPDGRFIKAATPGRSESPSAQVKAVAAMAAMGAEAARPAVPAANRTRPVGEGERDNHGRFTANGGAGKGGEEEKRTTASTRISDAAESIKESVIGLAEGSEQLDPATAAIKEVSDLAGPLLKPVGGLFKMLFRRGESDEEKALKKTLPWYRRMHERLKEISERGTGGDNGGGGLWKLGAAIGGLPGMNLLTKMLHLGKAGIGAGVGMLGRGASLLGKGGMVGLAGLAGWKIGSMIYEKYGDQIVDGMQKTVEIATGAWNAVTTTWDSSVAKMSKGWDDSIAYVKDLWKRAVETVGGAITTASDKVGEVRQDAGNWLSSGWDRVKSLVGGGSAKNREALIKQMNAAGIKDQNEQAMFMAQMHHESGGFRSMEESFKYGSPSRIMAVSATARGKGEAAVREAMDKGPEAVAELMYGGRMGNKPGEAYKFRGRGFVQLTGRDQYEAAGKALGLDLANNPDLAASPEVASKIATWYWKSRGLSSAAQAGDVTSVTRRINGGLNGLADRGGLFNSYLQGAKSGELSTNQGAPLALQPRPVAMSIPGPVRAARVASSVPQVSTAMLGLDRLTPAPAPSVPLRVAGNDKKPATAAVVVEQPLGQNVSDRSIAQVATGGLGSNYLVGS